MKNVQGLLDANNKWYVDEIYKQLNLIGYKVIHKLINCADLGVPQNRKRVFFFGVRNDINIPRNRLFDGQPKLNIPLNKNHIKLGDIDHDDLGNDPTNHVRSLMELYDPKKDKSIGDINLRVFNKVSGFANVILTDDKVCSTIPASISYMIKADHDNRNLSSYETTQLSSFPLDYDFMDQKAQYVCGMSVPPLAMYHIAKEVKKQWLKL